MMDPAGGSGYNNLSMNFLQHRTATYLAWIGYYIKIQAEIILPCCHIIANHLNSYNEH